ncbi:MAG: hypothetical protein Q9160_002815 [Pyrenula sp. 1 TL-2023]
MSTIDSLLAQLEEAATKAEFSVRYQLSGQLQRLARSIATPRQLMQHYGYTYTEQVAARIAADLGLFTILTQSKDPLTTDEIATKSGGDPTLVDRVLRHLASTYTIAEIGESVFAANEATHSLASLPGEGNIMFGFDFLNKAFQQLPAFLKENGYKNPNQALDTAFHQAFDTKLQFFQFFQQDKDAIRYFHASLTAFKSPIEWTAAIPLAEKLREADENAPLFVDVGGGHGNQCMAFRKATKESFSGRVVSQDLPETLAEAPKHENIEMMAQDFFQKQQIQDHEDIRQCLHDLPDEGAKQVLKQIRDAMSPQSVLLIDELVLPDTGASPFAMQLDFTMMAVLGSTERTVSNWRSLLGEIGLVITQVYRYDPELEYSILEAVAARE